MRSPPHVLVLVLVLGCHVRDSNPSARPVDAEAQFDTLLDALAELKRPPTPEECALFDDALAQLQTNDASFARAELARTCADDATWLARHQALADAGYLPSLVRLTNDALASRDWSRAEVLLVRLEGALDGTPEAEQIREVLDQLVRARWVDRGDPQDFHTLELAARRAIIEAPRELDHRADLIRLYVEQSAIAADPHALILAQATEREARALADELGSASPRLELVSGFVRELEGRRPEAIAAWTRALELNAALVEPCLWLGLAAIERHDDAEAQVQLQRYVDVHPDHVEALLALAVAAGRAGDTRTAERTLAHVARLAPDDPRPYWNAAILWEGRLGFDDDGTFNRYRKALGYFAEINARVGPTGCPERGAAGPDVACLAAAEALEHVVQDHFPQRLRLVDAFLSIPVCKPPGLDAQRRKLEEAERERELRRLNKLEEAAANAAPTEDEP